MGKISFILSVPVIQSFINRYSYHLVWSYFPKYWFLSLQHSLPFFFFFKSKIKHTLHKHRWENLMFVWIFSLPRFHLYRMLTCWTRFKTGWFFYVSIISLLAWLSSNQFCWLLFTSFFDNTNQLWQPTTYKNFIFFFFFNQ